MKSFLYGLFSFAFSVILFIVWMFVIERFTNGVAILILAYLPWSIVAYYWWRLWKSERHDRLVL